MVKGRGNQRPGGPVHGQVRRRAEGHDAPLQGAAGQGRDLEDILPEAFAVVREAAKRTLGQRHFDVQLVGGMVLHTATSPR